MSLIRATIEAHWPLTGVRLSGVLCAFDTRLVQRLESDQGDFVIKLTDQWSSVEAMQQHTFIFDFLQKRNFAHAPTLLLTKTGHAAQKLAAQYVYILSYQPGQPPKLTSPICQQLGQLTAQLHQFNNYPQPYLFTIADVLPEMLTQAQNHPFANAYRRLVQDLPDFSSLPTTLIHGEIIGNTVQQPNGAMCILDWDEAGSGTRILDLGHPLIQIFISEDLTFNEAGAKAFYRGYFSKAQLTSVEVDHIFAAGLFYALRYIIYGNTAKRWQRVQFALSHKDDLIALIQNAVQ